MNPKDGVDYKLKVDGVEVKFDAVDFERMRQVIKELGVLTPTEEEKARHRASMATHALGLLKPEDLTHAQRVELYSKLVELLAG